MEINRILRDLTGLALRAAIVGLLVCAATTVLGATEAQAAPIYPDPDPDPFYAEPPDLANTQPGEVLATRQLPPILIFPDTTVTLIKFRSTNSTGGPIAAPTTVLTPRSHQPDGPVLSYQHIINGLGAKCAVSRVLYTSDPNLVVREAVLLNSLLLRGWSIALPDHLGPTFAYGAARLGGQIALDGIRAVRQVPELAAEHSRIAIAGYSGGGMATAFAAAMAPTYAPELEIAGAATGGVPMNLVKMLESVNFNPHPAFGLLMAAAIGLEREYPDRFPISNNLNASGMTARKAIANGCTNEILTTGAGHSVRDYASSTKMIDDPSARAVVEENSLELFDGIPKIPILEWHSPSGRLIPTDSILEVNRRYCAAGVPLQAEITYSPEHLSAAIFGIPSVLSWLTARFRGDPAPSNC